jgi:hypothetical protein
MTKSRIDIDEPNLAIPNTDSELPMRQKLRKLMAEPIWKKSKTEIELPNRVNP